MINVLYIGPNASEWAQYNTPVSLAAAKWSRGFLSALSKRCNLITLTYTYHYPWPKGHKVWVGDDPKCFPSAWHHVAVSYPTIKYVREWWLKMAFAKEARKVIKMEKTDVVLIYNCYVSWQVPALRAIKEANPNVKVYPIILDGDDPRKDDWGWLKRAAHYSDGFIPLSWWVHEHITEKTGKVSFHFDGGSDGWRGVAPCQSKALGSKAAKFKYLVHTGALDQWRGLDFMTEVVSKLTARRQDVRFVFLGKSSEKVLKEKFKDNPYIEVPGFVTEAEMAEYCNAADVLLNVRDPNHPDNILNYPSKLPHYLSFGRPVVSTQLQSLSPDYNEVVEFAADDAVDSFLQKVDEVLAWSDEQKNKKYENIKAWFAQRKTWKVMVDRLVESLLNENAVGVNLMKPLRT